MGQTLLRLAGGILAAMACTIVFRDCTYVEFDRVRMGLRTDGLVVRDHRISVDWPDVSRLAGARAVLIVDVKNDADTERTVDLRVGARSVTRRQLAAGAEARLVAVVPTVQPLDPPLLALVGDAAGWRLTRAQVGNVRGFNEGLMNFIVVPADDQVRRVPWWYLVAVAVAVAAAAARFHLPRSGPGRISCTVAAAAAAIAFVTATAAPYVSPYRVLFAPHSALLLMGMMFLPFISAELSPLLRRSFDVFRRVHHAIHAAVRQPDAAMPLSTRDATVAYAILLVLLAASSRPRLAGDGSEYLLMALDFSRLQWPAADATAHFWLYSLLAAPLVAVTEGLYLGAPLGFLILNATLLLTAFAVVSARLALPPVVLLFVGPVLWWLDKVHAEVMMFAALAIAAATLHSRPGWALVALGVGASHNPAIALLLLAAGVVIAAGQWRGLPMRRLAPAAAGAAALAALHPIYFMLRLGRPVPLIAPDGLWWPSSNEALAVVTDANIGLIANAPTFALALVIAGTALRRRWQSPGELAWAFAATAILLFAFAQTTNVNHGGTRDMSRYALWLMPLAIPLLTQHSSTASRPGRRAMQLTAVASAAWCLVAFHPGRPERFLQPTLAAGALWTHWPGASNPLPEIFVERLAGREFPWWLPIATADCEKVLLKGQGDALTMWPQRCGTPATPSACVQPGALCYANKLGDGYAFEPIDARFARSFTLKAENAAAP